MTLQERKKLLQDAIRFEKTDRIPTGSNYWTYIILHEGHKLTESLYDYDLFFKDLCSFHEKYDFDTYIGEITRNPFLVTEAVDANYYVYDEATGYLNMDDHVFMNSDDFPKFTENPVKFIWETILPRKARALNYDNMYKAAVEYKKFKEFAARHDEQFVNVYGIPRRSASGCLIPFEFFFNYLRGMKETSIDLRRRYSQLKDACEALMPITGYDACLKSFDSPMNETYIFGAGIGLLAHSILSPKQFGDLYYPYLRPIIDKCIESNRLLNIFSEATFARFHEYFEDVPKGVICVQIEQDSAFDMRKMLPNIAISGGMTTDYLGGKSKEECIDFAKRLVDEVGRDGGLILGQNKMMSYMNDAKAENIMAIQEFARTYKG